MFPIILGLQECKEEERGLAQVEGRREATEQVLRCGLGPVGLK